MAAYLKDLISQDAVRLLGEHLKSGGVTVHWGAWHKAVGSDFEQLGLMDRGRRLATVLGQFLPPDFAQAAPLLVSVLGRTMGLDKHGEPLASGDVPSSFFYLPHSMYIASHGLNDLPQAMQAQHALTQRFTAEFSLRPFLQHKTQDTLSYLAQWVNDESAHVRRAVSEATRPRLPWATRLPNFMRDPTPVLPLLTQLRDDSSAYVRRSVANHLNDIGKDHPDILLAMARQWFADEPVPAPRRALLRHALRNAIKRGDTNALALFGHGQVSALQVKSAKITPKKPHIGQQVKLSCELHNPSSHAVSALADWHVHYVKADGSARPKVFKGATVQVQAHGCVVLDKTLSLHQMSTRTHHAGRHQVDIALNGRASRIGHFDLQT